MVEVEGGRRSPHRALSSVSALLHRGHCGVIDESTRSTRVLRGRAIRVRVLLPEGI